jgi:hypothetical protein
MTTLHEAAQQALEALEEYQSKGAPFWACDAAVAALRAALAQSVRDEVEWVETEPDARGMRLRDILNPKKSFTRGTVVWHTNKPLTNNPVFEVRKL